MRYVVTGGAGFIGSHLVGRLVTAGHEVVVLDSFLTGSLQNLAPWLERLEVVENSVTDRRTCAACLRGADVVLHQSALPSVPRSVADPRATHEANATGTLNLLLSAHEAGVGRVVYAGSSSVYGNTNRLPMREDAPANPVSPYAVSKLAGEHYMRVFHVTYGLATVGLRYFNVFGPRQTAASAYAAAVPNFITAALTGVVPVIYGDGEQRRDFTYVDNVVHANLLACEAPEAACGRVFNVGSGQSTSVNELWGRIRSLTASDALPEYRPARAGEVRDSLASLEEARRGLGYEPVVGLEEGLKRTIDFLAAQRDPRPARAAWQEAAG